MKWKRPQAVSFSTRDRWSAAIPLRLYTFFNVPVQVSSEGPRAEDELPLSSPS